MNSTAVMVQETVWFVLRFLYLKERQLESKEPIEALQFYNSMTKKKVSRHDTIHLIGLILTPLMLNSMQKNLPFDKDKYVAALKKYKGKKPERIYEALEKKRLR